MNDIVLFDPSEMDISDQPYTQYLDEGNFYASIVDAEMLDAQDNDAGETYQQLQLQWAGEYGEIRQKLIAIHNGEESKAKSALLATSRAIGQIAKAVGHEGPVALKSNGDCRPLMKQIGNKEIAIGIRKEGGYKRIKFVARKIDELPPFNNEKAALAALHSDGPITPNVAASIEAALNRG